MAEVMYPSITEYQGPIGLGDKLIQRVQKLEVGFNIGVSGVKHISGATFVTVEGLWTGDTLDVFIPKNSAVLQPDQSTVMISGACMFGGNWGLQLLMESGQLISLTSPKSLASNIQENETAVQVIVDDIIHPAEAENLYRLIEGFTFFAKHQLDQQSLEVWFHVPFLEYMLYALDLANQKVLSKKQYFQVGEAIEARFEKLKSLYQKRLPGNINCQFISPLSHFKKMIFSGDCGAIAAIFSTTFPQVKNYSDIAFLSYSLAYLELQDITKSLGKNAMALETFEEVKIFAEAKKLGEQAGTQLGILPVYLAPKVRGLKGEDLFWMDKPSQLLPVLKGIKTAYATK